MDDIDNLENKKIRLVGELINTIMLNSIGEIKKNIFKKLRKFKLKKNKKLGNFNEFLNSQILSTPIKNFFNSNSLSQLVEETNPLTEITHKRKVGFLLKKNSEKRSSNLEIREIHPSHYCKICPIETAEGKNAGLVWSLTKEARINEKGFLETPFYLCFLKLK